MTGDPAPKAGARWTLPQVLLGALCVVFASSCVISSIQPEIPFVMTVISLGIVLILAGCALKDWRVGIFTFFTWVVFEDLFRKFGSNEMALFVPKDLLALATYIGYIVERRQDDGKTWELGPLPVPVLCLIGWGVIRAFPSALLNPVIPMIGFRLSFFYLPMLYLGYRFAENVTSLVRLLFLMVGIGFTISILGLYQQTTDNVAMNPRRDPPHLKLQTERWSDEESGRMVRPNSVFVSEGRYAQYLFSMVYIGLGLLGYLSHRREGHSSRQLTIVCWSGWMAVLVALYMSGVKSAASFMVLSIPAWLLAMQREDRMRFFWAGMGLASVLFAFSPLMSGSLLPVNDYYMVHMSPFESYDTEVVSRPGELLRNIRKGFDGGEAFGRGTGSASLGLPYLADYDEGLPQAMGSLSGSLYFVEGGFANVLWEWGWIGVFFWVWFAGWLVWSAFRSMQVLRRTEYYWFAFAFTIYAVLFLFPYFSLGMYIFQNYLANAYLWFFCGALYKLRDAELQRRIQTRRLGVPPPMKQVGIQPSGAR